MKDFQSMPDVKPSFHVPLIYQQFTELVAGESTRHGGVSPAPYHSLNLGGSTADAPDNVLANNQIFFQALGVSFDSVAKSHQVHSDQILTVESAGRYEGYDALITNRPGVQLAITIADCTPIMIFDPVKKAVSAIHAGWKGTVLHIVEKTLIAMRNAYGTDPADCLAYVGTCIDADSFEVGEEVAGQFAGEYKCWNAERGKFFVDLKKANRGDLLRAGVQMENIEISPYSTVKDHEDYFSHRLQKGITGRMLISIGIRA